MGQAFVQSRASIPLSPFLFLFGPSLLLGFGGAFSLSLTGASQSPQRQVSCLLCHGNPNYP